MHSLKEEFRDIFQTAVNVGDGTLRLLDWLFEAKTYFPSSVGTITRWFGGIVGYFEQGIPRELSRELITS
ncbi:transposase [Funiculus sociatus GB2-M2]